MVEHRWIGVDERMPDMVLKKYSDDDSEYSESDYVLVWDGHKVDIAQAISDVTGQYWVNRYGATVKATFWMPLPTPPEQSVGR